ncbi:MAG: hypothetical protein ABI433_07025, partial [Burkholderiaceae bacterium]
MARRQAAIDEDCGHQTGIDTTEGAQVNDHPEWQRYKDAWAKGQSPAMDASTYNELFWDGSRSLQVVQWLTDEHEGAVSETLFPLAEALSPELVEGLGDSDRFRVWFAVLKSGLGYQFDHLFGPQRSNLPAALRSRFVANLAEGAVDILGRAQARSLLVRWWYEQSLLEEEREALVEALAHADALNAETVRLLGPEATSMVSRMVRKGRISELVLGEAPTTNVVSGSQPGNCLAPQIGALLQPVSVNLIIVDARLRAEELAGMAAHGGSRRSQTHENHLWKTMQHLENYLLAGVNYLDRPATTILAGW